MVRAENRDAIQHIGGLIRRAAPDVDPARRFRAEDHVAPTQSREGIWLREQRVIPHRGDRDLAVGGGARLLALDAADGHPGMHFDRLEGDGLGSEREVDLQLPVPRNERVERARGVANAADRDVVGTGRNLPKDVASNRVRRGGKVEVGERYDCPRQDRGGLRVPHGADDGRLRRLRCEQDLEYPYE